MYTRSGLPACIVYPHNAQIDAKIPNVHAAIQAELSTSHHQAQPLPSPPRRRSHARVRPPPRRPPPPRPSWRTSLWSPDPQSPRGPRHRPLPSPVARWTMTWPRCRLPTVRTRTRRSGPVSRRAPMLADTRTDLRCSPASPPWMTPMRPRPPRRPTGDRQTGPHRVAAALPSVSLPRQWPPLPPLRGTRTSPSCQMRRPTMPGWRRGARPRRNRSGSTPDVYGAWHG
mmetsp:Transcript_90546/g.260992  ORF Transcript_90546/g.260992 Transcript_90546/m.260992 type:complete len:227 (-) Transcript_90546:634-1314(-)